MIIKLFIFLLFNLSFLNNLGKGCRLFSSDYSCQSWRENKLDYDLDFNDANKELVEVRVDGIYNHFSVYGFEVKLRAFANIKSYNISLQRGVVIMEVEQIDFDELSQEAQDASVDIVGVYINMTGQLIQDGKTVYFLPSQSKGKVYFDNSLNGKCKSISHTLKAGQTVRLKGQIKNNKEKHHFCFINFEQL